MSQGLVNDSTLCAMMHLMVNVPTISDELNMERDLKYTVIFEDYSKKEDLSFSDVAKIMEAQSASSKGGCIQFLLSGDGEGWYSAYEDFFRYNFNSDEIFDFEAWNGEPLDGFRLVWFKPSDTDLQDDCDWMGDEDSPYKDSSYVD